MDISTCAGLLTGLLLVASAVFLNGDGVPFVHVPSLLLTMGGTASAMLIHFPMTQIRNSVSVVRNCFISRLPDPAAVISRFRELALHARRSGLISLETEADQESDRFFRIGLELVSNSQDPRDLRSALSRELVAIEQRHLTGRRFFEVMGAAAPVWGMLGTLAGLMQLLRSLDDPRQIGAGLALALMTTLYGSLFSSLFCIPLAGKLESRHAEELKIRELMIEGFTALLEEHTPGVIEGRLKAWLPPDAQREPAKENAA